MPACPWLKRNDTHKRYTGKQHYPKITPEMPSQTDAGCEKIHNAYVQNNEIFQVAALPKRLLPSTADGKRCVQINNGWAAN